MDVARRRWAWLWFLVGGALLTQTALNLVRPVTTYKLLSLGADSAVIGVVTAAYAVVPLITALWFGRLSDRIRELRALIAAGAALLALGSLGLAWAPNIALVAVTSAFLGLGHLVFTIAGQTMVARYSPQGQMNTGFGWFTAAFSAGQLVGPLAAGLMLGSEIGVISTQRSADITMALWVGAGLSLLAAPLMLIRPPGHRAPDATNRMKSADTAPTRSADPGDPASRAEQAVPVPKPVERATLVGVLKVKGVRSHMFASLALLAMLDILTAFLPLVGEQSGVSPVQVGALLAVRGAASILSRVFLPWLSSWLTARALLLISLYGSGLTLILPPLVITEFWAVVPLLILGGFCLGLGQPLTMTLVSMSVPDSWRGAALAVRLTGNRAGQVVMPLAAGLIAAPLGAAGAIWFSCAVLLLSGWEKTIRR